MLTVLMMFGPLAQGQQSEVLEDLATLQWKNRLIVINEVNNTVQVAALFEENAVETKDRDIIWFNIQSGQLSSNYSGQLSKDLLKSIDQQMSLVAGEVILIGKDGGIKSRQKNLELETLFSEIDSMPMRQQERRQ